VFFLCYQSFLPQEKGEFPACPSNSVRNKVSGGPFSRQSLQP
jgi:hypothetical protein